jgi:hypothetical protein
MLITSFDLVTVDLGQQTKKAHQIAGSFGGLGFTHRELA